MKWPVDRKMVWTLILVSGTAGCASVPQVADQPSQAVGAASTPGGGVGLHEEVHGTLGRGDVHRYEFRGREGQEIQVFLQSLEERLGTGAAPQLEVMNTTENARIDVVWSRSRATSLEDHTTGIFELPETGVYILRVVGDDDEPSGRYRFKVVELNRAPESVAATVRAGQVIEGERIDIPYDIDEFRYEGEAGEELRVALQGLGGRRAPTVSLDVMNPTLTRSLVRVRSSGNAVTLDENTRTVTLPETGTYIIRISGTDYPDRILATPGGPFRFRVDRVRAGGASPTGAGGTARENPSTAVDDWNGTYAGEYSYKVVGDSFSAQARLTILRDGSYVVQAVEHGLYERTVTGRAEASAEGILLLAPTSGSFRREPPCRLVARDDLLWGLAPCMGWRHLDSAVDDPMPLARASGELGRE